MMAAFPSPLLVAQVAYRDRVARRLHGLLCLCAWLWLMTALSHLSLSVPGHWLLPLLGQNAATLCVCLCSLRWLLLEPVSALLVFGLTVCWASVPAVPWGPRGGLLSGVVAPAVGLVAAAGAHFCLRCYYQSTALKLRPAAPARALLRAITALLFGAFGAARSGIMALELFRWRRARLDRSAWDSLRCVRGVRWRNWARTVESRPQLACVPRTLEDLAAVVAACAASGRRLRVVGGGFTWSSFCASDEVLVFCGDLDDDEVDLSEPARPAVWAECGATNRQLNRALRRYGLELPYNVVMETVRVGGITSTGTHGSGRDTATLGDLVEAFDVIDGGGRRRLLTEETIGAEGMSAARLSFGLFGVIARVRLRVVAAAPVLLRDERVPLRRALSALVARLRQEESAEVLWMPFASEVWLRSFSRTGGPMPRGRGVVQRVTDLLQMIFLAVVHTFVARRVPRLMPALLRAYPVFLPNGQRVVRRSEAIHYRKWLEVARATCVEVGFKADPDFANVDQAFRAAQRIIEAWAARGSYPVDININIRFTGPSGALLSAAYGPGLTCFIEALGVGRPKDWEACSAELVSEWMRIPGALPHWAKEFEHVPGIEPLLRERLGERLGRFRKALRACGIDPAGVFRNRLLSRLFLSEQGRP